MNLLREEGNEASLKGNHEGLVCKGQVAIAKLRSLWQLASQGDSISHSLLSTRKFIRNRWRSEVSTRRGEARWYPRKVKVLETGLISAVFAFVSFC